MSKQKRYTRKQLHRLRVAQEKEAAELKKEERELQKLLARPTPKIDAALRGCAE